MRLQVPQYGSLTGLMNPMVPGPPATRKFRDSSAACALGTASSGPSSASMRSRVSREGTNCVSATRAVSPPPRGMSSMKRDLPAALEAAARDVRHVHVVVVAGDHAR